MYCWTGVVHGCQRLVQQPERHAASVRQQQPVGSVLWRTDQEGQTVLLRQHRRPALHRAGAVVGVLVPSPTFAPELWPTWRQTSCRAAAVPEVLPARAGGARLSGCNANTQSTMPVATAVAALPLSATVSASTRPTAPSAGNEWILSGRVDYNFSDKDHVFWRVKMDHGTQADGHRLHQPGVYRGQLSARV